MITNAYAMFDTKAGNFSVPFFCLSNGVAIRMLMDLAQDMSTTVGRHPNDYILFQIGTFDDANGSMQTITPVNLGVASSFIVKSEDGPLFQGGQR